MLTRTLRPMEEISRRSFAETNSRRKKRIFRPEKKPRVCCSVPVKTFLGMSVLVQHDVCCVGFRVSVVIDQHKLESFILQSSLITRAELVAVHDYPRWTTGSSQRDELLAVEVTAPYTANSKQIRHLRRGGVPQSPVSTRPSRTSPARPRPARPAPVPNSALHAQSRSRPTHRRGSKARLVSSTLVFLHKPRSLLIHGAEKGLGATRRT